MSFPVEIETERLILRPYAAKDLAAHVEILADWQVTRWLSNNVPFPYRRSDGEAFIAEAAQQFEDGSSIRYAMTDKASGRHIGGIRVFAVAPESEIGYWMAPDFWGRGLGTEVLRAVIRAGFDSGIITCFVAQTAAQNRGSRRILEKTGFRHAGTPPPEYARCGHGDGCSEYYRLPLARWRQQEKDV